MTKQTFLMIQNYMQSCMGDSAHDTEHIRRVLYNALEIAALEKDVDYDVLITACLLHDIGRQEQFKDPSVCHAEAGAQKAYVFLNQNGFPESFSRKVHHCILTHRFRKSRQPESLEAKILFDADKLDVTGAIGIARTLMYKGDQTEPLYLRLPNGEVSDGSHDNVSSFFREYKFKLEKLYDRFYTAWGAELALSRRASAEAFYSNLYQEVCFGQNSVQKVLDDLLE